MLCAAAALGAAPGRVPHVIPPRGTRRLCEGSDSHILRIPESHICTSSVCAFDDAQFTYSTVLKAAEDSSDTAMYMYWSLSDDEIAIGVDAHNAPGWVGLGMSATGGMMGADIWVLREVQGKLRLEDMFSSDWVKPQLDTDQNLRLMSAQQVGGRTSFWFTRKLAPCDGGAKRWEKRIGLTNQDFDVLGVHGDTNVEGQMIWALGATHSFLYHGTARAKRGAVYDHVWEPTPAEQLCEEDEPAIPPGAFAVPFVNNPYEVNPAEGTTQVVQTYWRPPAGIA